MDDVYDYYETPAPAVAPQATKKGGIGLFGFIVICFLVWFFFLRTDYGDVWWSGTEYQHIIYCGPVGEADCHKGSSYNLPVTHIERSGDTHWFSIKFDNGGAIRAYGNCMKDESDLYPGIERYCFTTATDNDSGRIYVYLIAK